MAVKHNPPLVLVADDEKNTTIMLQRIFEREGYKVEFVNDGISALEAAERLVPDLILLDIRMPGLDGFEVLGRLRENPITESIPTILVTANARQPSDVARGMNLGADDYLYKPFAPQELVARAESKMKARQLEEALQRRTHELASLLQMSEDLMQHLERDELLELVLNQVFDLLPGDFAAIYQLDDDGQIEAYRIRRKDSVPSDYMPVGETITDKLLAQPEPILWPEADPLLPEFAGGMVVPLQHAEQMLGVLLLCAYEAEYDENHLRLFKGVGRQAALALRNAILHEIQVNYAQHLEDMVAARTQELQSAQQMLIRSEKLASVGRLAANIAHEINNPLQPITITLDDLVECLNNDIPIDKRGIEIIQESVERIKRIVSQLLEFTGKRSTSTDRQPIDVNRILERIIDLNRKFFQKEGMSLELQTSELPVIYGSQDQLEQVFMNLTLNAQAAMERDGKLVIQAGVEKNEVIVRFSDTGSGIPQEDIDKIFDPFYSTKPNGTGLGLFVSYGIIQGHQGSIEVESTVGTGSTFTVRLPIQAPTPH